MQHAAARAQQGAAACSRVGSALRYVGHQFPKALHLWHTSESNVILTARTLARSSCIFGAGTVVVLANQPISQYTHAQPV